MTRAARSRRPLTLTAVALTAACALTACGATSGGSGGGKDGRGTHTVRTPKGTVTVRDNPKVVVLDTAELDSAVTLGVRPVGATTADAGSGLPSYLPRDRVRGIQHVGGIGSPNLEKIAALKPDLILTNATRDAKNYDQLKAIAPTVMSETTGYPWKRNFQLHAQALGKEAAARRVTADYRTHVDAVTRALGGRSEAAKKSTNVVRFTEGADTRIYGDRSYIGTVLRDAGLGRPAVARNAAEGNGLYTGVSPERIDQAEADVLFYSSYGSAAKSGQQQTVRSGLWKNLGAVRNQHAFPVDDELWIQGIGYTAADRILDDLQQKLTR